MHPTKGTHGIELSRTQCTLRIAGTLNDIAATLAKQTISPLLVHLSVTLL